MPDLTGSGGNSDKARRGNAIGHQLDGQNVLFLDAHVEFAKRAFCAVEDDNIYTRATANLSTGDPKGHITGITAQFDPTNRKDAVLVHDPGTSGGRIR